jgi:hypothetical protein
MANDPAGIKFPADRGLVHQFYKLPDAEMLPSSPPYTTPNLSAAMRFLHLEKKMDIRPCELLLQRIDNSMKNCTVLCAEVTNSSTWRSILPDDFHEIRLSYYRVFWHHRKPLLHGEEA